MKLKRTLSIILCLCMALSYIPALNLTVHAATQTVRIEAEDAYWEGYSDTVQSDSGASNGYKLGNASGTYATWNEFNTSKINKNIHIYVAFCVDVPAAGTYQIAVRNKIRMSASSTPYAAILVNPQYDGKAYKLTYSAVGTNAAFLTSQKVNVTLEEGRNVIYMAPFTSDQSINWADADYIEITGAQAVTHIAPSEQSVAANAGFYHRFTNVSASALAGSDADFKTNSAKLSASTITTAKIPNVPFASYTVEAPVDGYYDIDLHYSTASANSAGSYAFALLVDGEAAEVKSIYGSSGIADISTYLTKGRHMLTIPTVLPLSTSKTMDWTDLKGLTFHNGLELSKYQKSPVQGGSYALEAERYAFPWRYPTIEWSTSRAEIGGVQPGTVKQTYAQLAGGAKLDKNQPILTYQVDVETAGTYTMNVSYRGYTGTDYYMIVAVDDTAFAKASYVGADSLSSNRYLARTTLDLTAGRHYIRLITMPGDVTGVEWLNVDYAAFSGPGGVAGVKDWTHLQSGNADYVHGFLNTNNTDRTSLGDQWQKALGGYQGNHMADAAGVNSENFQISELENLGWFSYTVNVPRDGFYDMQTYLYPDPDTTGTGKILLGVENANANLINQAQGVLAMNYVGDHSGWMDADGEYKAISVTAKNYLPMADSAESSNKVGYSMVLRVTLDNGKFYAFRIINDKAVRYGYSRYGGEGSASGWDGWTWVDTKDSAATALINGAGAQFKVERTAANTLTVTLNGTVLDTYTMEGVTSDNKVVSVGLKQYGNPASDSYVAEVPFEVIPVRDKVNIQIADMENGTVSLDQITYYVGDTVTLTSKPDTGYSQKLTLNGEPILVEQDGTYSFVATGTSYNVAGGFVKSGNWSDNSNVDTINEAQGVLAWNYTPNGSQYLDLTGVYKSVSVIAKNYLPVEESYEGIATGGYRVVLRMTLDNGKNYAFSIWINTDKKYAYNHFGADNSATGWSGAWCLVEEKNAEAVELLNGDGAEFKLERINGNTLQVSVHGTVLETYTMADVTEDNKVVSVGIRNYGNPESADYEVQQSFAVVQESDSAVIEIPYMENGTVTADKTNCTIGDTVTLTVTPDAGYSQNLTLNGEAIVLDWQTGKYSFVAKENTYVIGGGFVKSGNWSSNSYFNTINEAQGVLGVSYSDVLDTDWIDLYGDYQSISVNAKNYLPMEDSKETDTTAGFAVVLNIAMDDGNRYAFRIYNTKDAGYGYSRFRGYDSATGWDGWKDLSEAAPEAEALLNGDGVEFKVNRINANTLEITVNGTVLDTYTMEGITANNSVVAVGIRHYGNPASEDYQVELPFAAEKRTDETVAINIADMENGTVTTEMPIYKVGDIVELTVTPAEGYSQKLTINGEPIVLDWQTGKYSFVATENTYEIAGSFVKSQWSNAKYKWVDVRIEKGAEQWWIADLSCYLTKGEYIILVSGLMDYTGGSYDWSDMGALTVSGGITASNAPVDPSTKLTPAVAQWSPVLGDRIGLQFTFRNMDADDSVAFYIGDELMPSEAKSDSKYITYIAPAQMTDEITIKVNGVALARTYSVRTYANTILAGDYADMVKSLVREMLNYGGASQVYFQYHTERLANTGVDVEARDFSQEFPLSDAEQSCVNNMPGAYFYGASLLFRERNAVNFYFGGNITDCTFAVNGETVTPVEKNNMQCIEVGDILPQKFSEPIQVTVTRGEESITVSYSPTNYLERMYQKDSTTASLKNTLAALYYYHKAAENYRQIVWNVVTDVDTDKTLFYRNDNITNLPDPYVLDNTAVDGYYYLYGTKGTLHCYRSKNMMDWEFRRQVLYTWRNKSTNNYNVLGRQIWAPEVVYDPDTKLYYMFFSATPNSDTSITAGNGVYSGDGYQQMMVATCSTPDGAFSVVNFKDANSCGAENVHDFNTVQGVSNGSGGYLDAFPHYYAKYLFCDPAKYKAFAAANGGWRGADHGGYEGAIDPHPYIASNGDKYLFWVDSTGDDRICGVKMVNWLQPDWSTATVLTYYDYYTVADWKSAQSGKSVTTVDYELDSVNINEAPVITEHNGKYYMTFSVNNYADNTYLVAQAISDSILGPYTKLKESEGGVVLSGSRQGSQESSGTGHHSIVTAGDQMFMIYHRHNDPDVGGADRNHAVDEIKWITVAGREVMYVNGPTTNLQPRVEKHSTYRNIAGEATVTSSNNLANPKYLNDGILSHYKNANSTFASYIQETTLRGTTTFTFKFEEARTVKAIMVYNSRWEDRIFRDIEQIKFTCLENGEEVTKYITNVAFNDEYIVTDSNGKVTYVQPCSSAYAIFDELQVTCVEITIKKPDGQTYAGVSEIRILGQ